MFRSAPRLIHSARPQLPSTRSITGQILLPKQKALGTHTHRHFKITTSDAKTLQGTISLMTKEPSTDYTREQLADSYESELVAVFNKQPLRHALNSIASGIYPKPAQVSISIYTQVQYVDEYAKASVEHNELVAKLAVPMMLLGGVMGGTIVCALPLPQKTILDPEQQVWRSIRLYGIIAALLAGTEVYQQLDTIDQEYIIFPRSHGVFSAGIFLVGPACGCMYMLMAWCRSIYKYNFCA